jgi:GNAT superfamily N-acetyltransferase
MIRLARDEDADALARLAGELGYPSTADAIRERMALLPPKDAVFVAEQDGDVVGWLHAGIMFSLESGAFAQIAGLVVTESRRSSGIGAELVRAAEQWAREWKMNRVRVRTNVNRTRTHVFYERCGFTHAKTSRVYEKSL